jgi:prophage regulatory protein
MNTVLRVPAVMAATGLARPTIYARIKAGLLTPPIKLGRRASAWPADEVSAVNDALIAGRPEGEIRELVISLIERRTNRRAA